MKTLLLALTLLSGCSAAIRYVPEAAPPTALPAKMVRLTVIEARAPDKGGGDLSLVGTVRGGYGNPFPFREKEPAAVVRLVKEASQDALLRAGVGVRDDAPIEVVARIVRFWMDGYVGYEGSVEVEYLLVNGARQVAWGTRVVGTRSGVVLSYGAGSKLLGEALSQMATQASAQFGSPQFQEQIK
jgi:hypothetical protein